VHERGLNPVRWRLAAAPEPTFADGITGLLALAEKLHIGHDRLVRMVGVLLMNIPVLHGCGIMTSGRSRCWAKQEAVHLLRQHAPICVAHRTASTLLSPKCEALRYG